MELALADKAKKRAKALGFSTFSSYVVQLIRNDIINRGEMSVQEMPASEAVPSPLSAVEYPKPPRKKKT